MDEAKKNPQDSSSALSPQKLPISVVLLTRNEEGNLRDCLQSCDFAKELIVVDDESSDRTVDIALEFGARVIRRSLAGNWGEQKTFAIQQASQPWLLLIDADERVSPQLRQSIFQAVYHKEAKHAYWIQRENHFVSGKVTHGCLRPDWVLRLIPKEGAHAVGKVHESVVSPFPQSKLKGRFIHYPYRSWDSYYKKIDVYSRLAADRYLEEGKNCRFVRDVVFRPMWAFFKVYFLNLGFLDGKLGFIFSMNHYFYTMAKYVRYYYLKNHNGKI